MCLLTLLSYLIVGDITQVSSAKVGVYSCPFDTSNTETKGTVLIKSVEELKTFSQGEENLIEAVSLVVIVPQSR